eukprot:TRINITY_DN4708_c0_g1_i3.p1 TRINITY_DN4708_c0_g1~~TRINITY_DN4708_c0_g1_i3.p1  ORF type:complete len:238 (-),score=26.94 TRINITY_DN4708_c0_g1_i3:45-758(-)
MPPQDINKRLLLRELGQARTPGKVSTLPNALFLRVDKEMGNIPQLIRTLEHAYFQKNTREVASTLNALRLKVSDSAAEISSKNCRAFVECRGEVILLAMLRSPPPDGGPAPRMSPWPSLSSVFSYKPFAIQNQCMSILRDVSYSSVNLATLLGEDDKLLTFLFGLLHDSRTFEDAESLIEEVLPSRINPFNLSNVPGLFSLIRGFGKRHLGLFCRIVAMLIFASSCCKIVRAEGLPS